MGPVTSGPITVTAPVRIADVGGWTDTWFARSGHVCSIAVRPGARVILAPTGPTTGTGRVRLRIDLTGESYDVDPSAPPGRHPVLEGAVAAIPPPMDLEVEVGAEVPPGSGLGTSASVAVALLAGLAHLRSMDLSADELASMAHGVELRSGLQSGVQDQWAAAHGGVAEMVVDYPGVRHGVIDLGPGLRTELDRRLVTVYLGRPHSSSQVHEQVIAGFAMQDPTAVLHRLRIAAADAAAALRRGDADAYAGALTDAHETIRTFHPDLVSEDADRAVAVAVAHRAAGWKVNGAAGNGGSITILGPQDADAHRRLREALAAEHGWRVLDHRISDAGVLVEAD